VSKSAFIGHWVIWPSHVKGMLREPNIDGPAERPLRILLWPGEHSTKTKPQIVLYDVYFSVEQAKVLHAELGRALAELEEAT